jgi:predicted PurR-regulated permease PerM
VIASPAVAALGGFLVLVIVVVGVVLCVLAILMPLFVYQIKNQTEQSTKELRALNDNIGRFLAMGGRALPPSIAPTAPQPLKPPPPTIAKIEEAAKYYGVSGPGSGKAP